MNYNLFKPFWRFILILIILSLIAALNLYVLNSDTHNDLLFFVAQLTSFFASILIIPVAIIGTLIGCGWGCELFLYAIIFIEILIYTIVINFIIDRIKIWINNRTKGNLIKLIVVVFLILLLIFLSIWNYLDIKRKVDYFKEAEKNTYSKPLDEEKTKRVITAFMENYINYYDLNLKIEKISTEPYRGYIIDKGVTLQMYDGYVGFTDGTGAKISFTPNIINEWPEDKPIPATGIYSDRFEWPTGGDFHLENQCITSPDKECSIRGHKSIQCTRESYVEDKDGYLKEFFGCKKIETKEFSISDKPDIFSVKECDNECFKYQKEAYDDGKGVSVICSTKESPPKCQVTPYAVYKTYDCILDFSMDFKKADDGKLIILVNTPKNIPNVYFKRAGDKSCDIAVSLKSGENVINTNCTYEELYVGNCITASYNDLEIMEKDCRRDR